MFSDVQSEYALVMVTLLYDGGNDWAEAGHFLQLAADAGPPAYATWTCL